MSIRFDEQTVIVTGAGNGLGRAHALEFARRGANVVVNDLGASVAGEGETPTAADGVVAEIEGFGGSALANNASVTDDEGVAGLIDQTIDRFGRVDVLVNNAGILRDKSFHKMTMDEFQSVIDVHLIGSAKVTGAVWPHMREQNYGRVVMTTSSSGLYGNFGQSNYGAGKMGVVGLMNTLRLEGQKYNVHCNTVSPVAWTRMTAELFPAEMEDLFVADRVTPAVIYLAGKDAPNGVTIAAGAGGFARAVILETAGRFIGKDATAEDIAENWEEIADAEGAEEFKAGYEQVEKFVALAAEKH